MPIVRRQPAVTLLLLLVLGAAVLAAPAPASAHSFRVTCAESHVRNDDPIVFPGQPGRSHRHAFFGARSADARSTTRSLRRSATTCSDALDTASYWSPTIEVSGRMRRGALTAYYQRAGKRRAAALPAGLRMIAGDMHASTPQATGVTSWQCTGSAGRASSRQSRVVPRCAAGQQLAAWVRFPDCWNGRTLDSIDHRSHMAYAVRGRCSSTHPVELMKLVLRFTWTARPASAKAVTFGDGMVASTGFHADFWNAWHQPALEQLRWDCIEVARSCGIVTRPTAQARAAIGAPHAANEA